MTPVAFVGRIKLLTEMYIIRTSVLDYRYIKHSLPSIIVDTLIFYYVCRQPDGIYILIGDRLTFKSKASNLIYTDGQKLPGYFFVYYFFFGGCGVIYENGSCL